MAWYDIDGHVDRSLFKQLIQRGQWPSQHGLTKPRGTASYFAEEMKHPVNAFKTFMERRRKQRILKDVLSGYHGGTSPSESNIAPRPQSPYKHSN